jgi:hypothetical protein
VLEEYVKATENKGKNGGKSGIMELACGPILGFHIGVMPVRRQTLL